MATDANTVIFNLVSANGNFPYLVSVFNAQSLITPEKYVAGTTLDKVPAGTGAWKIVEGSYDIAPGASSRGTTHWWGGKTPLDGPEFTFFDDTLSMVTAYQGGQIDALVQFDVLSGAPLFDGRELHGRRHPDHQPPPDLDAYRQRASSPTSGSARPSPLPSTGRAHPTAVQGQGRPGQRPVIWQFYPYFIDTVPQRAPNIDQGQAAALGRRRHDFKATLQYGRLNEIPDLAVAPPEHGGPAGMTITPAGRGLGPFYDSAVVHTTKPTDPPC